MSKHPFWNRWANAALFALGGLAFFGLFIHSGDSLFIWLAAGMMGVALLIFLTIPRKKG